MRHPGLGLLEGAPPGAKERTSFSTTHGASPRPRAFRKLTLPACPVRENGLGSARTPPEPQPSAARSASLRRPAAEPLESPERLKPHRACAGKLAPAAREAARSAGQPRTPGFAAGVRCHGFKNSFAIRKLSPRWAAASGLCAPCPQERLPRRGGGPGGRRPSAKKRTARLSRRGGFSFKPRPAQLLSAGEAPLHHLQARPGAESFERAARQPAPPAGLLPLRAQRPRRPPRPPVFSRERRPAPAQPAARREPEADAARLGGKSGCGFSAEGNAAGAVRPPVAFSEAAAPVRD